jgi:RNA polymerase sigma-70 factor (ECF subfamily)
LKWSTKVHDDQIETWIRDAKAGSSDALGALFSACRNYLLAIANRQLPDLLKAKVGASDIVQDTAMEAQQSFASFKGERRDQLLAWLRQILSRNSANAGRRFCSSSKRRVSREISLAYAIEAADEPHDLGTMPSQIIASMEEQARVEQAIARLPNSMQHVILLRHREQIGFVEIGARLGCSPEAARKRWARAVERLQEEIGTLQ